MAQLRRTLRVADVLSLPAPELEALRRRIRDGSPVDANGCWVWGASTTNGYGQISVHDSNLRTHQMSYVLFIGPIPAGMNVCHSCDHRRCNNPAHFFAGTQIDNIRDMRAKGRGVNPPVKRGATHPKAALSDEQVGAIRAAVAAGQKQRDVAALFACSQSTVWRLVHELTRSAVAR